MVIVSVIRRVGEKERGGGRLCEEVGVQQCLGRKGKVKVREEWTWTGKGKD